MISQLSGRLNAVLVRNKTSDSERDCEIGVVFQQIQKYEAGINRISCSRLLKILDVLDISIIDFFAGIKVSDHLIISEEECQLFNAYRQKNPQTRRAILTLLGNPN